MEAQWKLRYSQEGLKKAQKSRLAKSLLWFKQGTRPVVTSHFASEAWGWGELLRRVCQPGCFLCSGCHPSPCSPYSRGLVVGRLGRRCWLQTLRCSTTRSSWSGENTCLPGIRKMLLQQEFGKKTKAICYLKVRPYTFAWGMGRGADGTWSLFGPERRFTWVNMLLETTGRDNWVFLQVRQCSF